MGEHGSTVSFSKRSQYSHSPQHLTPPEPTHHIDHDLLDLEAEDDGPDEAQDQAWVPVHDVLRSDVLKVHLGTGQQAALVSPSSSLNTRTRHPRAPTKRGQLTQPQVSCSDSVLVSTVLGLNMLFYSTVFLFFS